MPQLMEASVRAESKPPARLVRFTRAAKRHEEPAFDVSTQMAAAAVMVAAQDVPSYGFLRAIVLLVTCTTAGNVAATAFTADGPFNAISDIMLSDVNGAPLVGPIDGYDLYLINKYGGYQNMSDPRQSPSFLATTGAGATGGSFGFLLRIPVEFRLRDALGALANMNAAATYKLRWSLTPSATVYATAPTALAAVRVRAWLEAWTQPDAQDLRGNPQEQAPPALGTVAYWSKHVAGIVAGQNTVRFPRVGNLLRNLILVNRDNAGARSTANFPDPFQITWDGRILTNRGRDYQRHLQAEGYDFAGTVDAADGLDSGVFAVTFTDDFDGKPGGDLGDFYLPTAQATRLELSGSFGAIGALHVLTNDVAPNGDIYSA